MKVTPAILKKETIYHVVFWLSYFLLRIIYFQNLPGSFSYRVMMELTQLPLKMLVTYAILYFSIEKLLLSRKYVCFVLSIPLTHYVAMILNKYEDIIVSHFLLGNVHDEFDFWEVHLFKWSFGQFYPVIFVAVTLYIFKRWYENTLRARTLAEEIAKAELRFLKAQLHPHFLFNTLNNIYALSLTQPSSVPGVMLRLSELLSYMLYESNHKHIQLKKEIQSIYDYTELEKLRLGDRLELSFKVDGHVNGKMIAPMILLPFVENCFKHSTKVYAEKIFISIFISISDDSFIAHIENSKPNSNDPPSELKPNGIGLSNVMKRLEILYPGNYEVNIFDKDTFLVKLRLRLG